MSTTAEEKISPIFDARVPPPTVGALLRLAWMSFRRRIFERVKASGFDDIQPVQVLLFRYPTIAGMRPTQLAEQTGMSKQSINDLMRQMESKGYFRLVPDPTDKRARLIELTESGERLFEVTQDAAYSVADDWEAVIGKERFADLRQSLLEYIEADQGGP